MAPSDSGGLSPSVLSKERLPMIKNQKIITNLVQKFDRIIHEYRNPKYNETLIRVEFVNLFWKALGWDVDNEKGYARSYRDVIHKDELKVEGDDQLVYQLYGLREEEIKIVEGKI